jgi:DNA-binding XRE family transcriptional regulator
MSAKSRKSAKEIDRPFDALKTDKNKKTAPLPKTDKHGRVPALEYARISLARDLIRDRKGVRLSQQKLAELAGIRQETLSRIETGKHTATPSTVDKIMRVIEANRKRKSR